MKLATVLLLVAVKAVERGFGPQGENLFASPPPSQDIVMVSQRT